MSHHSFLKDGLTIEFDYYPSEAPCYDIESWGCSPGSPSEVEVTAIILRDLGGEKDLLPSFMGGAYTALVEWAETEAWLWLVEQRELSEGDPD